MIKTRVYVEESDVAKKYYAQIQMSFFGIKYWDFVDYTRSDIEASAIMHCDRVYGHNKSGLKEYAEAICERINVTFKEKEYEKLQKRKHKATRKVWSYLFPKED